MRDVWPDMAAWIAEGRRFALARVLETWGSAPRRPGATMLVDADGRIAGSVSGGCIEGAVVEAAVAIAGGAPARLLTLGVDDETAWSVGLSCGGTVSVFVEPAWWSSERPEQRDTWAAIARAHEENEPLVVLTRVEPAPVVHAALESGGRIVGASGSVANTLASAATTCLATRRSRVHETPSGSWFLHALPRADRLVIVGAGQISVHLVALARELEFETVVIDPRGVFADAARFRVQPDRLLVEWPEPALEQVGLHGDSYVVVLTHDPKIDDPALHRILRSEARYVGALGSQRSHEKRRARLREAGFSGDEIDRIHAPVGLEIGAASPGEIALSILAEVVAVMRRRSGGP